MVSGTSLFSQAQNSLSAVTWQGGREALGFSPLFRGRQLRFSLSCIYIVIVDLNVSLPLKKHHKQVWEAPHYGAFLGQSSAYLIPSPGLTARLRPLKVTSHPTTLFIPSHLVGQELQQNMSRLRLLCWPRKPVTCWAPAGPSNLVM